MRFSSLGRHSAFLGLLSSAAFVTACSGGGGGGAALPAPGNPAAPVVTLPTPPAVTSAPAPAPLAIVTPSTTSSEYRRNWGIANISAEAAWSAGATGKGIKVAVIDTGVDGAHDLSGRVTSDSFDIITNRAAGEALDSHGTMVAGIIASNFNNSGTVGVAYNADILGIRTDRTGSCAKDCQFSDYDIARSIDYAIAHGARVINLSLGSDEPSSFNMQAALKRATDAGIVVVVAAGNDSRTEPSWPGQYAADSRYGGLVIAVGALGRDGVSLAGFSDKAGFVQNAYVAAPGENVVTGCDGTSCWSISGTSFAAPHVAGAIALLLEGFPNISGRDAVDIVLRSARDLGSAGADAIFGRGTLDIARAFQPLGTLSTPTAQGTMGSASATPGTMLSAAFGDALTGSAALATIGYDDYRRLFTVDLGAAYRGPGPRSLLPAHNGTLHTSAVRYAGAPGASLSLASQTADRREETVLGLLKPAVPESLSASYVDGALRLDFWTGRGGTAPAFDQAPGDAFTSLVQSGQATRVGYGRGAWTFSAEQGGGRASELSPLAFVAQPFAGERDRTDYLRFTATRQGQRASTSISYGSLTEEGGPLGSWLPTDLALSMPAQSGFVSVAQTWSPARGVSLAAEGAVGRTDAKGPLLSLERAVSSSWRLSAATNCALLRLSCTGLSFDVSQPLRIEGGYATATLADRPLAYLDPVTFSDRRLALSPSGREIDFRLTAWKAFGAHSTLSLQAQALTEEHHQKGAPVNYGLLASWRSRF